MRNRFTTIAVLVEMQGNLKEDSDVATGDFHKV
jgi:hypothetical protein